MSESEGYLRLEQELKVARRWGRRAVREMHATMVKDLRAAERRARRAERRTAEARQRARRAERRARAAEERAARAERELAEVRSSTTWRVGRALVAVPSRLKRGS